MSSSSRHICVGKKKQKCPNSCEKRINGNVDSHERSLKELIVRRSRPVESGTPSLRQAQSVRTLWSINSLICPQNKHLGYGISCLANLMCLEFSKAFCYNINTGPDNLPEKTISALLIYKTPSNLILTNFSKNVRKGARGGDMKYDITRNAANCRSWYNGIEEHPNDGRRSAPEKSERSWLGRSRHTLRFRILKEMMICLPSGFPSTNA